MVYVGGNMQVETSEIEFCKVKINYTADTDTVKAKYDEAIADLRKKPIPGFRKGKAPDYAIKAKCKQEIKNRVKQEMGFQAYDDIVFDTKMKPIGHPQVVSSSLKGNEFSCEMVVHKKPEFELKPYTEYEIPKPAVDNDAIAQTEAYLRNLQLRLGDVEPYDEGDVVEMGDQVTLSFVATIDGKSFDGSVAEGKLYTVGENQMAGFDEAICGMSAGETKEFNLTMPADLEGIGGKPAIFSVTLHMGTKRKPCVADDEMAKKCGCSNLDELNGQLQAMVGQKIKKAELDALRKQVCLRLVQDNDFKVPEFLIEPEMGMILARSGIKSQSLTDENKEQLKTMALNNVKLSLILDSIRDLESDAVLSDGEAQEALAKRLVAQGLDPKQQLVEYQKSGALLGMISGLRDEFTLQWLVSKVKILE